MSRCKNNLWGLVFCTIFLIILSFFLLDPAYCSDSDSSSIPNKGLKKWQLLFSTGSYFTPNPFYDMSLGLQYSLSDCNRIRIGIGFIYDKIKIDRLGFDDGYFDYDNDYDTLVSEISINCGYVRFYNPRRRVCPYLGTGPFFKYSGKNEGYVWRFIKSEDKMNEYAIGVEAFLGVNFKISGYLSFHAEYILDLSFGFKRYEEIFEEQYPAVVQKEIVKINENSFAFESNTVKGGVSIRF